MMTRHAHFRRLWPLLLALLPLSATTASVPMDDDGDTLQLVKLDVRRLPSLNTPRSYHTLLVVDGQLMAVGGHTSGFVPTATAEFLLPGDTAWRQQPTVYPHDFGLALRLSSGQVLLIGGAEQALGIGQTFTVERYDPATKAFDGFGCLDTKRIYPQAVELDSGHVCISGNWYHDDAIEMFDGQSRFLPVKAVTQHRVRPYMFRTAIDDAFILGTLDIHGDSVADLTIVDRVKGPAFRVPLLAQWQPLFTHVPRIDADAFIGDEQAECFASLMAVQHADDGRMALAVVDSSGVQLLPSTIAPAEALGHAIHYFCGVIVDREARRAYLTGVDDDMRFYFFCLDLQASTSDHRLLPVVGRGSTRLYYTDPQPDACVGQPLLTPGGHIVLAGGSAHNFNPSANVFCFCLGPQPPMLAAAPHHPMAEWLWWLFFALALLVLAAMGLMARKLWRRKRQRVVPQPQEPTPTLDPGLRLEPAPMAPAATDDELMQRLNQLMDEQKPYLNADLKVADVALALQVNARRLSDCIKAQCGMTFPQLVNKLRIDHAMQLLQQHPEMKASVVGAESGFANDQSFFRAFKLLTGKTPTEWRAD